MSKSLYIPGLGGKRSILLQRAYIGGLNIFRKKQNHISFFDPRWETNEEYSAKFDRLLTRYEEAGKPPTVWAVSAGASLAVRLCVELVEQPHLNIICGKVLGSQNIGEHYRKRAPAFVRSVEYSQTLYEQLDPNLCTNYIPKENADGVIDTSDMTIPGSKIVDLPPLHHARAIGYALLRYLPKS